MHVELASCRCEAVTVPGCRGDAGGCVGEVSPDLPDGIEAVEIAQKFIVTKVCRAIAPVHVELAISRCEAVTVPGRRGDAGGCVGEVRPDLRDGIKGVKVAKNGVFNAIPGPLSPVNVQLAGRRSEAVVRPCRGHGASGWLGEVRPDPRDWIIGVKVTKHVIARHISTAPMHVELASCRSEAMTVPGCRWDAGACVGEIHPGHCYRVEGVKIAKQIILCIYTSVNVELASCRFEAM